MRNERPVRPRPAFTLIELMVCVAIIALLVSILLPAMAQARQSSQGAVCLANQRQLGLATRMYMDEHGGGLFHHHEGWVLDDGTQVEQLPEDESGCHGGGMGNSQAEKPWVIFLQPYLKSRTVAFCPSDPTPRSQTLADNLYAYNGAIEGSDEEPPPDSELAIAERDYLTIQSYLLNSVFTHRSARFAVEGALHGFATDNKLFRTNPELILMSERNSEAMNAPDNEAFGAVGQDDYDTWVGEAALVRWGEGPYSEQGWVRYNRHRGMANYVFTDGHAERRPWREAREDQFPDRIVRQPLDNPPH